MSESPESAPAPEQTPASESSPTPEAGPQVPNFEQAPQPEIPQQEAQNSPSPEIRLGKGNCWETLSLDKNASKEDIGSRYRDLAKKYHPDAGGNPEDFKVLQKAYEDTKNISVNGSPDGIAPEATMAAGAGVAASGMAERGVTPEQRQAAMDAMFAAANISRKESVFYGHHPEQDLNAQHEARIREIDEDYARRKKEDEQFNASVAEMQRKIDEEIAAKKAQEKAEQEKMQRYIFSPTGPDEFVRDMQTSAIKDIIMPLSESGLLSPQEINEFMAVGRAVQTEANRPDEKEQKRGNNIEALVNPNVENSALLHAKTSEYIYNGETKADKREKAVRDHGYDVDKLIEAGRNVKKQLKKVEDEDIGLGGDGRNFSKLSENDRIVAELLRGLAVSKRGEGENSYSRHSFLSVGLAELLSDQMGKLDKAVIKPNIGKGRDEVCLKAEGLLNEIPAGIVKNQYKTAWDILKSEIY